jgi:hypothetical protein
MRKEVLGWPIKGVRRLFRSTQGAGQEDPIFPCVIEVFCLKLARWAVQAITAQPDTWINGQRPACGRAWASIWSLHACHVRAHLIFLFFLFFLLAPRLEKLPDLA